MLIPEDSGGAIVSRIGEAFARLRRERRTGLVTYVTAGDPDMARSAGILQALDRAGADVIEVGVPFSDPLADGPVIQRATERALAGGASLSGVLDMIERLRPSLRAPIVQVTAKDAGIAYSKPMEDYVMPDEAGVVAAVRRVLDPVRGRA